MLLMHVIYNNFIDKNNISVTPSPFLICFEKREHEKPWKKYKLKEISFIGNHLGTNQN